jgi:diaminohydroxyphosphoribosylaminopyrimidine deaminase/5-amino-6-(5-phosphoribosylamino)uracil reductase
MRLALRLAAKGEGRTHPNPPVGAVVVRAGRIVGRGYHHRAGEPHAEVLALRQAGPRARGACLYITLEPCCTHGRTPPCTRAVLSSGVRRVVVGVRDPNPLHAGRGIRILKRAGLGVVEGVMNDACADLIRPFAKWITRQLPYVTLKLGMTLDGRIADSRGRSKWITGPRSRERVQELRGRVDAVLVGGHTVRRDDPALISRTRPDRPAYRIVVTAGGNLPLTRQILGRSTTTRTIVATTAACPLARHRAMERTGAEVWRLPSAAGKVSLRALLGRLGRLGLLHVLCEGGGELAGDLLAKGLADECWFFLAPRVLGSKAVAGIGGHGWSLAAAPRLVLRSAERVGDDVLIRAWPPANERLGPTVRGTRRTGGKGRG